MGISQEEHVNPPITADHQLGKRSSDALASVPSVLKDLWVSSLSSLEGCCLIDDNSKYLIYIPFSFPQIGK